MPEHETCLQARESGQARKEVMSVEDDTTGCACCTVCECEDAPEDGDSEESGCCGAGGCCG